MENKLLFIEKGAMPQESIDKLEAKGNTVVYVKDISKIKTISDVDLISKDIVFKAAVETLSRLNTPADVVSAFGEAVLKKIKEQSVIKH